MIAGSRSWQPIERAYFELCRVAGQALRASRYARVHVIDHDGELVVHKRRAFYAPLLIALGGVVVRILDTGMRVMHQGEWEARERLAYRSLYGLSVHVENRTLILPHLPGETLASLLDGPASDDATRQRAIELAARALAQLHAAGFTHADAMAENVLVDLDAGVARWFDFETVHDATRSMEWRRADDVRALIATSLLRVPPGELDQTLSLVMRAYGDPAVRPLVAESFRSTFQRPLAFHLGQARLSFSLYREIGHLLRTGTGS